MTNTATQRILLAEDDDAMRVYLERALVNAGYKVDSVDRGTAAVPLLVESDYDLLLSDIVMPEMDGIELAQKCNEVSPHTKVMFITGFAAVTLKASRTSMASMSTGRWAALSRGKNGKISMASMVTMSGESDGGSGAAVKSDT